MIKNVHFYLCKCYIRADSVKTQRESARACLADALKRCVYDGTLLFFPLQILRGRPCKYQTLGGNR